MSQYYTLVTDVGLAKLANAASLNKKVAITTVAVGDGGGNPVTPSSSMTSLVNQVWSGPVTRYETDPNNPTQLVIEGYIPADVGGWTIREVGIFDADGDLIAVGNYDDTNKPAIGGGLVRDLLLRTVIELGNYAGQVTIEIDPAIVLASRQWVDEELGKHNEDPTAHPDKAYSDLRNVSDLSFLNKIKAVDGSQSGLDADLVRGLPANFWAMNGTVGVQDLPSGIRIVWGNGNFDALDGDSGTYNPFPIAFPSIPFQIVAIDVGIGCNSLGAWIDSRFGFRVAGRSGMSGNGEYADTAIQYIAIGRWQ
jgi:hypothetical protein